MSIEILNVGQYEMSDFYGLPKAIYAGDPYYINPFAGSVEKSIERGLYKDRQRILLARENGLPVARLVARISPELNDETGDPYGMLGFFEALNRPEIVKKLLSAAVQWLRENGCHKIIGPINGDTWHKYRFSKGPFEKPPFMMEPYNPSYYSELWESCGFVELSSYYSTSVDDIREIVPVMERYHKRVVRHGVTFRQFDMNRFDEELGLLYQLSTRIFSGNYLYTPIAEHDFKLLYEGVKGILHPELIWFSQDKNGEYTGFIFSVPDYAKALTSMKGSRGLLAKVSFLLNKRAADTLNIKTMGVLPEQRGTGLGAALMYKAYQSGIDLGYNKANLCLVKEDNSSGRFEAGKGEIFRKYVLYHYEKQV